MSGNSSLYNIAVRMTMVSNHGPILAALAHSLTGIHHGINQATAASNRFRVALVGAATAFIGTGLLRHMAHVVDQGGEMVRTMDRMKLAGWSPELIHRATTGAFGLARQYPSLSAGLILESEREMAPVLGSREEALRVAPSLAQLMRVLQIHRGPEQLAALPGEIVAAVRAGELTANTLTDERFLHFLGMMTPAINAWGGLLGPRDFMMAFKYGRAATMNMSDRFMTSVLPTLMQEIGASSAGTGFQTAFQAVIGGRMRLRSLNAFADLGLIDRSKVDRSNLTNEGRLRHMQPGLLIDAQKYLTDTDVWVQEHLIPAMISHGIITKEGYDLIKAGDLHSALGQQTRQAITQQIAIMWADRTGQQIIDTLALQVRKLVRDAGLVGQASDLGGAQGLIGADYEMAKTELHESWRTFSEALALPNMRAATRGLKMLTEGVGELTDKLRGMDQDTVRDIFISAAVGLAAFVGVATVAVIGALVGWPVILGAAVVAALAGAATYVYRNRDWVMSVAKAIGDKLYSIPFFAYEWEWHKALAIKIGEGLMQVPGLVYGAVMSMAQGIADSIKGALGWLGGLLPGHPAPGAGGAQPQHWVPPARGGGGLVPIRNVITIDGHRIGEAVSHYIAVNNTHVLAAPQYDGGLMHVPVDLQFS
ncbi:MAG TPA: hypothetical protein VH913_16855 [Hyphomicrobiaceae bacterium]